MNMRRYLDFDLIVGAEPPGPYSARVIASPVGEASASFELPFSPLELENFLLRVGRTRRGVRRIDSPEMHAARGFGSRLYGAVFAGEIGTAYRRSLDIAERDGMGLRLRLRLDGAGELGQVPWEFLYDDAIGGFLVLSVKRPLVRYMDLPRPAGSLSVTSPLRILVMVSSPSDFPPLDVQREQRLLSGALADLVATGRIEIQLLERGSLGGLQRALRRQRVHILHFMGHGGYDAQTDEGVLLLEDEQGRGRRVSASSLATVLGDHDPLRLVTLNACEGARTGVADPFGGVATELVRRGAPAVIAMQFEITDEAAIAFSHEFHMAVADGYPVDAAVADARKAVFAMGNDIEWATPVLYLRSVDGRLFDVAAGPETGPASADAASLVVPEETIVTGPPPLSTAIDDFHHLDRSGTEHGDDPVGAAAPPLSQTDRSTSTSTSPVTAEVNGPKPGAGLRRTAAQLAILAAALVLFGSFADFLYGASLGEEMPEDMWYTVIVAALAAGAGAAALHPRTRRWTGPGLIIGAGSAAVWGLAVLIALSQAIDDEFDSGFRILLVAHVILLVAVGLAVAGVARDGDAHVRLRPRRHEAPWFVIALGLAGAVALLFQAQTYDEAGIDIVTGPLLVAAVPALLIPVCAAVVTPARFAGALLAGWIGGAAAIFAQNTAYLSRRLNQDGWDIGGTPTMVFGLTLLGLTVVIVLVARMESGSRPATTRRE